MKVVRLEPGRKGDWNDFVATAGGTVGHRVEWASILSDALGQAPRSLLAEEGGRIEGILPLALVEGIIGGRALVSLPWLDAAGPLARSAAAATALLDEARNIADSEDCSYVEIRSLRTFDFPGPVLRTKVLMHLRLDEPERMWKQFSAKVRNQVRKAEKSGLVASVAGAEELDAFYRVFSRNMRDLGVPVWSRRFFRLILERFGDDACLVLVKRDGSAVGGGLLLLHNGTALVPSASSLRSEFTRCPNHLLYWTALVESRRRGAVLFDFGRSSPGSGTWRFKKQWGSVEIPCHWHYYLRKGARPPERNTSSRKLRFAVETWKRLPLPIANRLGPMLVRRIP